ncbi:MAG UNVERIFIED_CONTAM: hypothetical protein LVR29_05640 [Microcystis novacekii LVE1205-3]|jgi:hypothetical protein
MSYTTLDFTAFLETVQPFDRLPVEVRRSLGQKLQPFRYEMGNAIPQVRSLSPSHLVLLYEGEADFWVMMLGVTKIRCRSLWLKLELGIHSGGRGPLRRPL